MVEPILEHIDVFIRGKYLTSDKARQGQYEKVKDDIEAVWGYKKESITLLIYPENVGEGMEMVGISTEGRTYLDTSGNHIFEQGKRF